jgi:acetyl-CoA synthetase
MCVYVYVFLVHRPILMLLLLVVLMLAFLSSSLPLSLFQAPTAIRALMRFGNEIPHKYDLSSLRVIGSVGEPINPETWRWYHEHVGNKRCAIVDTYWQTETGGIVITPLPGAVPTKPGSACFPFFGVKPVVIAADTHTPLPEDGAQEGLLCLAGCWPGIARTVYNDHGRYLDTYLRPVPGLYFTGDGCSRDVDGYYWITGRVDGM